MVEEIKRIGRKPVEHSFVVNVRSPGLGALPDMRRGVAVRLKPREIGSASWDELLSIEVRGATLLGVRVDAADVPICIWPAIPQ